MNRSFKLWLLPALAVFALLAALVGSWISGRTEPEHLPVMAESSPQPRPAPPRQPPPPQPRPEPVVQVAPAPVQPPPPPAPWTNPEVGHRVSLPPQAPPGMIAPPPPAPPRPYDPEEMAERRRLQVRPEEGVHYGSVPPPPPRGGPPPPEKQ